MLSTNFEFLRPRWPELAGLGGFAEAYAHSDPASALGKLRSFGEQLVLAVYHELRLPKVARANLIDLLDDSTFRSAVPPVVLSKLHALRREGNRAVHGNQGTTSTALVLLREAFDLGRWFFLTYKAGTADQIGSYAEPPQGGVEGAEKRREKRAILERVASQEAQMQKLLEDLSTARDQAAKAEATAVELEHLRAQAAVAGQVTADVLSFDERATRRRLIDTMLIEAGWSVGPNGANTDQVKQEVLIQHQPTDSKEGNADYVLYDGSGNAIGVVEAKRTAKDARDGQTQGRCYAEGIEKQSGHRPVIFCTNGFDVWIWDDHPSKGNEPARRIFGFPSPDSLEYLVWQRSHRTSAVRQEINTSITNRPYQIEAVKKVLERFAENKRKALIVLATGTGKTRVAISLADAMSKANWARRILFLCDRRELRKQAHDAFKEHMPGAPRVYVTADTANDRDKRIYLATYPAMMKCFSNFDVGFFDLIVADESHRTIYNRYRDIFQYFDAFQVGLTATPVGLVHRNTYDIFQCEDQHPTAHYSYEEAINARPQPFLVPFHVMKVTTRFLREGISYARMSRDERLQLEEQLADPETVEHDPADIDKNIFNKDTNRTILRNLMENGIKNRDGSHVGKSIIFARNHNHAVLLRNLFEEMYPQYGSDFCMIIDTYDPRAEELIDDFKDIKNPLTVAISVDMLDTGIDVEEVVNLVFAKPVKSFVKFWQMIGRGTRLCPDLFGPGEHKTHFQIFDHWGNFEWFDEKYTPTEAAPTKSLMQLLFESRIQLAETALAQQNRDVFDLATDLIAKDIAALPDKSLAVREKWREVKAVAPLDTIRRWDAATKSVLLSTVAPLMQWCPITGHEQAHKFDNLVCKLQVEHLKGSSRVEDLKADLRDQVSQLPINLTQVRPLTPTIERVKTEAFWSGLSVEALEDVRGQLRGVIKYRQSGGGGGRLPPRVIDVREDDGLVERTPHKVKLDGLEQVAYRNRVLKVLTDLFDSNDTLQKIKNGQPVGEGDLQALVSLVLTQDPQLDLRDLEDYYPETAGHLDQAIRGIIGRDAETVAERFTQFIHRHTSRLSSHQVKFLDLLQNHIAKYGAVEIERLYEPPFTSVHTDGLDGVFPDDSLAQELLELLRSFKPQSTSA